MDNAHRLAMWAVTPGGAALSRTILENQGNIDLFVSSRLSDVDIPHQTFDRLSSMVFRVFHHYRGHIFIMATGIVVRTIAPLLENKTEDPAVVVMDEKGRFAVSLVSGHLGGANELAEKMARITGGQAVITTATDVNELPSIDNIAKMTNLVIENPSAIKTVNMAILNKNPVVVIDPYCRIKDHLNGIVVSDEKDDNRPGIYIGEDIRPIPDHYLILRPKTLVVGIGCNRNTAAAEMAAFLDKTMADMGLSKLSIRNFSTIDIKKDEPGLRRLADDLNTDIEFYSKIQLNDIQPISKPSETVFKHVGVKSVCEAAALISAKTNILILPKTKTPNVTLAIAKIEYSSSGSAPET